MKKMIFLFISVLSILVGILFYAISQPVLKYKTEVTQIDVSLDRIKEDVKELVSTKHPRNFKNIASLNQAAEYIKKEFEKLDLVVEEQIFKVENQEYKNLICSIGPMEGERIIIGAHYDVCGNQPGADDNASGVAGLLEIARQFKTLNPTLKYRIDFVAFTLEEPPFFRTEKMGSYIHAKHLKDNNIDVKAMICLEMIGYFTDKKNSQDYPIGLLKLFYPNEGDFITVVGKMGDGGLTRKFKKHMIDAIDLKVKSINAPSFVTGVDFSDDLNYWNLGYKAIMINNTGFYRNKNYHKVTDTEYTLDYNKMAEVIKGVTWAVINIK